MRNQCSTARAIARPEQDQERRSRGRDSTLGILNTYSANQYTLIFAVSVLFTADTMI